MAEDEPKKRSIPVSAPVSRSVPNLGGSSSTALPPKPVYYGADDGIPDRRGETVRQTIERAVETQRVRQQPPPASNRPPDNKSHDYAGIGLFELLGLIFGLPPGDALYHGKPIDFRMLCFIAAGCFCAGLGTAWPAVRRKFPQQALVLSIGRIASDARAWLAIILIGFLYAASPEMYRRAIAPSALPPTVTSEPPSADNIAKELSTAREQGVVVAKQLGQALIDRDAARSEAATLKRQLDEALADAKNAKAQIVQKPMVAPQPAVSVASNLGRTSWSNLFNGFTQPGQLQQLSGWWVIITAPPENSEAEKELNTLFSLSSNLSKTLRLAGLPDYSMDLDAPKLEGKALRGITVHGRNEAADFIAATLSNCFIILRTAEIPAGLFDYYRRQSSTIFAEDKFVWLEIGNGSPWKGNCRG
jgi:hypothetical protein